MLTSKLNSNQFILYLLINFINCYHMNSWFAIVHFVLLGLQLDRNSMILIWLKTSSAHSFLQELRDPSRFRENFQLRRVQLVRSYFIVGGNSLHSVDLHQMSYHTLCSVVRYFYFPAIWTYLTICDFWAFWAFSSEMLPRRDEALITCAPCSSERCKKIEIRA